MGAVTLGHTPWDSPMGLTQGQFKMSVQEDAMEGGVLGATDLTVRHDGLRVQCEPFPGTLLGTGEAGSTEVRAPGKGRGCTPASLEVASSSCSPSPDSKG